jgi:DNA invertase Pin-like site-specific DNA recombinase
MSIGYARVSTQEQSLDAQIEELKAAGAERISERTARGTPWASSRGEHM